MNYNLILAPKKFVFFYPERSFPFNSPSFSYKKLSKYFNFHQIRFSKASRHPKAIAWTAVWWIIHLRWKFKIAKAFRFGGKLANSSHRLRRRREFSRKDVLNYGYKQKQRTALWEIPHTCAKRRNTQIGTISFHFQLVLRRVNDKLNIIARWLMQRNKKNNHNQKFCGSC